MARKQASAAHEVINRVNAQMRDPKNGVGDVLLLGSNEKFVLDRVPSGSLTIDRMIGGGYPRGRHVELYGDWSAGKSLLTYLALIEAQKRGEVAAIVDGEHVFDADWFRWLGGNPNDLVGYFPKTADQLAKVLQLFVYHDDEVKGVDVVGIDSVASMLPKEELEKDIEEGDDRVASLARLMSRLLRRVTSQNDDTLFIWTNQWRDKIARIPGLKSTPGGLALGFYASIRIEMMLGEKENEVIKVVRGGKWVERKIPVGQWVNSTAKKNKTAKPMAVGSFMFNFEERGIDLAREVLDLGMMDGLIERKGDYFETALTANIKTRDHGVKRFLRRLQTDPTLMEFLTLCIAEQTAQLASND